MNRFTSTRWTSSYAYTFQPILFVGSFLLGLVPVLAGSTFGGDGISYLDMGDALFAGRWKGILNSLWSPLYPTLLGLVRWVIKPPMRWQPTVLGLTNFAIYVVALLSFHWFWSGLLYLYRSRAERHKPEETYSDNLFWILGYAIFLYFYLDMVTSPTPDILFSSFVFISGGCILGIRLAGASLRLSCLLGLSLGLGYLAKAIMLPLSGISLATAFVLTRPRRLAFLHLAASTLVFASIASPYMIALSQKQGYFTWGETGRLNYAWHVNKLPFANWQGGDARFGSPVHPTHQIYSSPATYEFEPRDRETYAPWYDPSIWMSGVHPSFDLRGQFVALKENVHSFLVILLNQGAFIAVLLVLLGMGARPKQIAKEFLASWYVWAPSAAAFGMYSLIWIEPRYLDPFMLLFWGATLTIIRLPQGNESQRLFRVTSGIVVIVLAVQGAIEVRRDVLDNRKSSRTEMEIAQYLLAKGISSGTKVAVVDAQLGEDWQKLLGISVIAEIPPEEEGRFWSLDINERRKLLGVLGKTGAVALVVTQLPSSAIQTGWERIGNTKAYMLLLNASRDSTP